MTAGLMATFALRLADGEGGCLFRKFYPGQRR